MKEAKTSPPTNIKPNLLKRSQKSFFNYSAFLLFPGFSVGVGLLACRTRTNWTCHNNFKAKLTTIISVHNFCFTFVFPRDYNSLAVIMYKSSRMNRENVTEITQLTLYFSRKKKTGGQEIWIIQKIPHIIRRKERVPNNCGSIPESKVIINKKSCMTIIGENKEVQKVTDYMSVSSKRTELYDKNWES